MEHQLYRVSSMSKCSKIWLHRCMAEIVTRNNTETVTPSEIQQKNNIMSLQTVRENTGTVAPYEILEAPRSL